jgi:cytochrome c oxidase assembly protein subunit 11
MAKPNRNGVVALSLVGVVAGMVALSYAAVPLYQIFCRVTGYGGTTQVAEKASGEIADRIITVRFDAGRAKDMEWNFQPAQRQVEVKVGEDKLIFYTASNPTDKRITGTAVFNVTPLKAGVYFNKVECFCFTEQTLDPGQSADMPVSFFIDPDIMDDVNLRDVDTITLSYTFFKVREEKPKQQQTTGLALEGKPSKVN